MSALRDVANTLVSLVILAHANPSVVPEVVQLAPRIGYGSRHARPPVIADPTVYVTVDCVVRRAPSPCRENVGPLHYATTRDGDR